MADSNAQTVDTKDLFADVREYIATARAMLDEGKYIELEGLGEKVELLCAKIQQMPVGEATKYGEELDTLVEELNALQAEFMSRRDELKGEITAANSHKQAARAYKQSESMHVPSTVTDLPPEEADEDDEAQE